MGVGRRDGLLRCARLLGNRLACAAAKHGGSARVTNGRLLPSTERTHKRTGRAGGASAEGESEQSAH